jgi:hypothetical protein
MEKLEWKIKAEEFIKSHLNNNNSDAVEAAIYFLSRGEKSDLVEKAIEGAIKRWKEQEIPWGHWTLAGFGFPARVLRLIKWAEIGSLKEEWSRIYSELTLPANLDYHRDLHSNNSIIYAQTLPLFRSDLAIQNMRPKLLSLIFQWQDCLESFFNKKWMWKHRMEKDLSFEQANAMLVTTFIFGVNRLQVNDINKKILSNSIQYLIDNQSDSGSWSDNESISQTENVKLSAMGIHALYPTRENGSKRCIDKTVKWLLRHQQPNGGWYQLGRETSPNNVYTTVFVLDALELANGGSQVTFIIPDAPTIDSKASSSASPVNIDTVNVTINNRSAKKKKRVKKITSTGSAKESKFKEWKNCDEACLIFNDKDRILFYYQGKDYDLCLKHSGPVYELINELAWGECKRDDLMANKKILITKKGTRRILSDVLRRTNELLNTKVRLFAMKHKITDIPDDIKFVGFNKIKKTYQFYIKTESE